MSNGIGLRTLYMKLEMEKKHVKIALFILNELIRICERNAEKKRIGACVMELRLIKDVFNMVLNEIKDQDLRTLFARRINQLDEKVEALRKEIFEKKE